VEPPCAARAKRTTYRTNPIFEHALADLGQVVPRVERIEHALHGMNEAFSQRCR
jgi:hypothetical protein